MKFLRNLVFGPVRSLGLLSDMAMVGTAAMRVVKRPRDGSAKPSAGELVLVAGAAFRLLRRVRRVRRNRRMNTATADSNG